MSRKILFLLAFAALEGCGNSADFGLAPAKDNFAQNVVYNNKVDVLWVVESASSMGNHQQVLGNDFGSFVGLLNSKGMDYHMAITTTDMSPRGADGQFLGSPSVMTNSTPNLSTVFQQNIIDVGTNGSAVQQGLAAMENALSPALLGRQNSGFFRSDALLAIVFVTDENDSSAGNPSDYAKFLDQLKPVAAGAPRLWMVNYIGSLQPGDCMAQGAYSDPGDRYISLANTSNGQTVDLCTGDLAQALANVQERIVEEITQYHLSRLPVVGSIVVAINGQLIAQDSSNGWTYDGTTNVITFHGSAIPAANARISIDYKPVNPV